MTLLLARPSWAGIADGTRAGSFPGLTNEIVDGYVEMVTHPVMGKVAHHVTPANAGAANQRCEMVVSHRNLVPGDHVFHSAWYMAGAEPSSLPWHENFQFKNSNVGSGSGPPMAIDVNASGALLANGEHTYTFKLVDLMVPVFLIFEFIVTKGPGTGSEVAVWVWRPGQATPVYASPTVRKTNWLSTRENGPGGLIFDQVTGGAYLKHGPYHYAPAPYVVEAWWGPPCTSVVGAGTVAAAFAEALGPSASVPAAPAAPHIDAAAGAGKVTITRGAITGARAGDVWQLYRDTSAAFTAPVNVSLAIPLATTVYDDTTVTNGVTYYYRASVGNATDGYGAWDVANTPSATPVASGGGVWVPVGSGTTYAVTAADIGHTLRVGIVASNAAGASVEVFSAPTAPVTAVTVAPANTSLPTVSGTTQSGQTLSGSVGVWTQSPTGYAWKWQRETSAGSGTFTDIAGASGTGTAPSFVLTGSEVGLKVRLSVTATNSVGSTTAVSAATATVTSATPSLVLARYALALDGTNQKVLLSNGGGFGAEPLAWGALVYLTGTAARTYHALGFPLANGTTPARDLTVGIDAAGPITAGWHEQTVGLLGQTGFPANKWVWLVASRNNDTGGTVRTEFCDMATGVWSSLWQTGNAAWTFSAASGGPIVIGGVTQGNTTVNWQGRFLAGFKAHAYYTDAQIKATVSSQAGQFYIDPAVLIAAPSAENVWSTADAPASAIQDLKGTAHESSRVGTPTVFDAGSAILPLKVS